MFKPVTFRGDDAFQLMLDDLGCLYYVEEVRAFILGAVLSSDSLTPSEALDFLIKDEEGEDLAFENPAHYTEFISQFFALWNEIAESINTDQVPPLSFYPLRFKNDDERLSAAAIRANELKLFLTALSEGTKIEDIKDETTQDLLFHFENLAENMHTAVVRMNEKIEEEDLGLLESLLEESDNIWHGSYPDLKNTLLDLRKLHISNQKNNLIHADFGKKPEKHIPPDIA